MNDSDQIAITASIIRHLQKEGSWCGETHVQKATYVCQELTRVEQQFRFILYKHGPYSFELSACLQGMIADDLVKLVSRPPYGPSLRLTAEAETLAQTDVTAETNEMISFVSKKLGRKGVTDLEKIATAIYVNKELGEEADLDRKAKFLTSIKPHVALEAAKLAFQEVKSFKKEIAALAAP